MMYIFSFLLTCHLNDKYYILLQKQSAFIQKNVFMEENYCFDISKRIERKKTVHLNYIFKKIFKNFTSFLLTGIMFVVTSSLSNCVPWGLLTCSSGSSAMDSRDWEPIIITLSCVNALLETLFQNSENFSFSWCLSVRAIFFNEPYLNFLQITFG